MCLTSIMPEEEFWNILQSLLKIESPTVRKGTIVMLQIVLCIVIYYIINIS